MHALEGKTALVTGAGRGIGREIARQLAATGTTVALLARSRDQLEETARLIADAGHSSMVVPVDLTVRAQRAAAVHAVRDELGPVDILINNAAVAGPIGATVEMDPAEWATTVEIALIAPVELTTVLLPDMLDRKWGRIVNLSTAGVAASRTLLGTNAYLAAKAGLETHTVNLAVELADSGVSVNVYRPGLVDTAMSALVEDKMRTYMPALAADVERNRRAGRMLTPEASAAALLAHLDHDETGKIWHVDKTVG